MNSTSDLIIGETRRANWMMAVYYDEAGNITAPLMKAWNASNIIICSVKITHHNRFIGGVPLEKLALSSPLIHLEHYISTRAVIHKKLPLGSTN